MGRKRKGRTTTVRVRLADLPRLKAIAQMRGLSLPEVISLFARGKIK